MKKIFFALLTLFSITAFAQETDVQKPDSQASGGTIYSAASVDVKPDYPGGVEKFYKFIAKNVRVPDTTKDMTLKVFFIVEPDGTLSDLKVTADAGAESGAEIVRVMKLSPKWLPAKKDGNAVRCSFQFPINIRATD